MLMPVQTLMKTLKIIPVMLIGPCLRNRTYSTLDYLEGLLITSLVSWFVWDFQLHNDTVMLKSAKLDKTLGALTMMLGYVMIDSFTSNFQDIVYQKSSIGPGHMLLGMETISSCVAWLTVIVDGSWKQVMLYFSKSPDALPYVLLYAFASGLGAYTCTVTVRLFGPAVFTMIMTSRQVISLFMSVILFQHSVGWINLAALGAVTVLILLSSARRVRVQMKQLSGQVTEKTACK